MKILAWVSFCYGGYKMVFVIISAVCGILLYFNDFIAMLIISMMMGYLFLHKEYRLLLLSLIVLVRFFAKNRISTTWF